MIKLHKVILVTLTVAMMVVIFCFSAEPAETSDRTSGFLVDGIVHIVCPDYDNLSPDAQSAVYNTLQLIVRKTAHFTEFAVLGLLLRLTLEAFRPGKILSLWAWLFGTLYAATDELHQLLVSARSGQIRDVILDSCGVLAGVMVARIILLLVERHRLKKPASSVPSASI